LRRDNLAVLLSGASVMGVVATAGLSLFPFILPSSLDPSMSLTLWDSSSSRGTLALMLVAVVLCLPLVLAYTAFVYRVLRGRVTAGRIEADPHSY
jgi:cytochrome d ubiquinol oxidase subunit II